MNHIPPGRLTTLDAFRGLAIVAMILVNNPGSWDHAYPQLLHADWIGWTFTDLIFPCFLFIVGVAMWFSFRKHEGANQRDLRRKILTRAALIFLVGLFISWFPFYNLSFENLHFAGVLQRIAVSYLIASFICITFRRTVIATLAVALLLGYWLLIARIGAGESYSKELFFGQGIDLISLRSCIASAVPVMVGYLVGSRIDRPVLSPGVILTVVGIGIAMILVGALWSLVLPIIKSVLWSSSYVVFATGFSVVAFGACLWVIEVLGVRSWATPFVHFGLNPLFLYALSMLIDTLTWINKVGENEALVPVHTWIYGHVFEPWAGDFNGSLMYAICFVLIHWLIAWGLYRKGIFFKV